jgi:peptidyl-tRNA hydrolase
VVVKCNNYPELKRIHEKADTMNIANCIIHDAGRTQVINQQEAETKSHIN